MRRWLFAAALLLWFIFVLNVSHVAQMAGLYTIATSPFHNPDISINPKIMRNNVLMSFPPKSRVPQIHQVRVFRAQNTIQTTLNENYYLGDVLGCNAEEFWRAEYDAIVTLEELACMRAIRVPRQSIVKGLNREDIEEYAYVPCDFHLQRISRQGIFTLLEADRLLLESMMTKFSCKRPDVMDSMAYAQKNVMQGRFADAVWNFRSAWSKIRSCYCN
jgi:hypothetical protein